MSKQFTTPKQFEALGLNYVNDEKGLIGFTFDLEDHAGRVITHKYFLRPDKANVESGAWLQKLPRALKKSSKGIEPILIKKVFEQAKKKFDIKIPSKVRRRQSSLDWEGFSKEEKDKCIKRYFGAKALAQRAINIMVGNTVEHAADPEILKIARRYGWQERGSVYVACCSHERIKQLFISFPFLASCLFVASFRHSLHFKTGKLKRDPDPLDLYEEIGAVDFDEELIKTRQMVMEGHPLKEIAEAAGIPFVFRKLKQPKSFFSIDVSMINTCRENPDIVHSFLPKQYRSQIEFFRLCSQHRPDINKVKWIGKQIKTDKKIISRIEYNSSLYYVVDWLMGEENSWNEKMSFQRALEETRLWHNRRTFSYCGIPEDTVFSDPWLPGLKFDIGEIIPLRTAKDLIEESARMHHCVSSYASRVHNGGCYIYSFRKDGKSIATIELRKNDFSVYKYYKAQCRGPCNATVSNEIMECIDRWLLLKENLNTEYKTINYYPTGASTITFPPRVII